MHIEFSEKYRPLFDLLVAWNVVKDAEFAAKYTLEEQRYWRDLSQVDTVLISGGRDSGKSFALSCFNPIAAKDYNHRILYTRQTMSSTDNSITEALETRLQMLGYGQDFDVANKIYSVKGGAGKISITGQKTSVGTQTAKLKSLEDFSIFETDEGEELENYEGWKKIKRSMRAQDVQCLSIIVFNPPTTEHWIYKEFYQGLPAGFNGVKGKVLYIHTTYIDNGEKNMAPHNWQEYESMRKDYELYKSTEQDKRYALSKSIVKNYKEYKTRILGGFKDKADGVIFEDWEHGKFDESLPYVFGQDYGFSQDPTTLVKVAVDKKRKRIYAKSLHGGVGMSTAMIGKVNKAFCGTSGRIVADSAEPRLIDELKRDYKLNIRPCVKGQGSVTAGIKLVQSYTLIIEDSEELSKEVDSIAVELDNYVWHDKRAGVPVDKFNHFLDAIRYAAQDLLKPKRKTF